MTDPQSGEHARQRNVGVLVTSGSPEDRPAGFPCFGCGVQVDVEQGVAVRWPDGRSTHEAVCPACSPRYTAHANLDRERDEAELNGSMDRGEGMP